MKLIINSSLLYLMIMSMQYFVHGQLPTSGCDVISLKGTCFSYFRTTGTSSVNWDDARTQCLSGGYDLATVTSRRENSLMYGTNTGQNRCWIGLHDEDVEGTFVWADGSNSAFRNWGSGEPNNHNNQDCAYTWGSPRWDDNDCQVKRRCYFCSTKVNTFGEISGSMSSALSDNATLQTNTTLYCVTEKNNNLEVKWSYLSFSGISVNLNSTTNNNLGVSTMPVFTSQPGFYSCEVSEDGGTSKTYTAIMEETVFPTIILPSENITLDVEFNITFEHILICESKGKLSLTTIYWTNSKFENISSHILTVTNQLLSDDRIFYCIAENTAGRDVRSVRFNLSITVMDIDDVATQLMNQTEITNDQSQVASAAVALLSGAAEDEEQLEQVASTYALLVNKSLNNGMPLDEETVISLLRTAEEIIDRSLQLNSSSYSTMIQMATEGMPSIITGISTPELIAINSIQSISQNILRDLDSGVQVIESRTVTIVVQARSVTESQSSYVFPGIVNSSTEFNTQFSIPQSVAQQLAVDGNIAVATTLINRDSNQPVDPGEGMSSQASDILIIETLQEESNVYGRIELSEDAEIAFYTKFTANLESICVALNGSIWNSDGIQTTSVPDENLTICSTSHFTSFAVFVTPHDIPTSETEELVISIFSYLLVSISFIFLLISLILFLIAGKPFFKVEANIIYFNYCLSMLLATGLFLLGIESGTHNDFVCLIIGFLLHYIWLAVFTWTLCNGIFIIFKLVIAVMTTRKIYPYLIVFGWTFPLVIPIITIAVTRENYVDPSEHCFLNINYGVIWAFISPIIILLLINLILLTLAVVRIVTARAKAGEDQRLGLIKNVLIYSLILTPILGLPWVILIFNIFIRSTVVEWIFILLNGGMGLIFFIVVTLGNAEVRAIFKRKRNTQTTSNTISSGVNSNTISKFRIKKKSISGDSEMQKNTLPHGPQSYIKESSMIDSSPNFDKEPGIEIYENTFVETEKEINKVIQNPLFEYLDEK